MTRSPRRRVDWILIEGADPARARMVSPSPQMSGVAQITSALVSDPSAKTIDRVLRDSVEFARTAIHLERVAIFLVTPDRNSMVGTWGTDASGHTTDEHDLMYLMNDMVRGFFAHASQGYSWCLYKDCPLVSHEGDRSRVVGQGWNAYTVIQGGGLPLGILFNDSAISGEPVDERKQARAALLCSLLGRALEPCLARFFDGDAGDSKPQHPLVRGAVDLLEGDPALSCVDLAAKLGVSKAHLTRTFRLYTNTSIVDYRNELRLARFLSQINEKPVLEAVLGSGFGSYPQFHRVFRARFGQSPRDYLFERRIAGPAATNTGSQ